MHIFDVRVNFKILQKLRRSLELSSSIRESVQVNDAVMLVMHEIFEIGSISFVVSSAVGIKVNIISITVITGKNFDIRLKYFLSIDLQYLDLSLL